MLPQGGIQLQLRKRKKLKAYTVDLMEEAKPKLWQFIQELNYVLGLHLQVPTLPKGACCHFRAIWFQCHLRRCI